MLHKLVCFGVILMISQVKSHLNLYLNQQETMRLLGLSAELYYVREGQINDYALHFTVPVPANVKDIAFTWQSVAGKPLPYRITITTSDPVVLPRPAINISKIGEIPQEVETFSIALRCSGVRAAEVEVTISLEVTLNRASNNVTELVFKRKKICLQQSDNVDEFEEPHLQRTFPHPPESVITLIVGGTMALVSVLIILLLACCARGKSNRKPKMTQPSRATSFQRLQTHPSSRAASVCASSTLPRSKSGDPDELRRRISEITVERCRVRLCNLIQEGTFGRVYRGTYNEDENVIVKTVGQHASQTQVSLLLQEGMSLYGASHAGILSVLGVCIEDHTAPFILYSADNNTKNLKLFLLEPVARTLTTIQIVKMTVQLASAVGHLHSHGVLHKDIASRNCIIDDNLTVKLTDNSLSRDLFPQDYHCLGDRENRPIKWMSLEALTKKQFTEASDAWAFGVLIWELCTLAKQPYQDVDAFEMEAYLKEGFRLAQPLNCPDELFTMMAYCWAVSIQERPTFSHIEIYLQDFYNQITKFV